MTHPLIQTSLVASVLLLAACGGSGGSSNGGSVTPIPKGTVTLSAVSLATATRMSTAQTGTHNRDTDAYNVGTLSGTINAAGDTVALAGGGVMTIAAGPTQHAAQFTAEPQGADRTIGIVGLETSLAEMPTGSVTYAGTTQMTVLDGSSVYALTGDSTITADFDNAGVDTTLNNLNGTVTAGTGEMSDVNDVGTITFTGSTIAGTGFADGTATVTSTVLSPLSGSETNNLNGSFFGPAADEAGATFVVNDAANDGITVMGTALAD